MINSRSLDDVPLIKDNLINLKHRCEDELNIDSLIFTSTFRDAESQQAIYAQGRTTPGHRVTNARAWHSYHNYRMAADVAPVVDGQAIWNNERLWQAIGQIGRECGLAWGGDFHSFKDMPHFQLLNAPSIAELIEQYGIEE